MIFEIKSIAGRVLFTADVETIRAAVEKAIKEGANLRGANLYGANLYGANLRGANLYGANLYGANLYGANLYGANLRGANLYGANLYGANLYGANLYGADLGGANLYGANLYGANLRGANLYGADLYGADLGGADLGGANLYGANLYGANLGGANLYGADLGGDALKPFREDLRSILDVTPAEVPGLLAALRAGKVDGSTYTGECACLVGTIANIRHVNYEEIPGLEPDSGRPAERWFARIHEGDTPETSPDAAIAAAWIEGWMRDHASAAPGPVTP